jgi:putative membrane protein
MNAAAPRPRPASRRASDPAPHEQPTNTEADEPDYRFSLANERTFLAWLRTSLALMAAAVAVVQLVPADHLTVVRRVLGVLLAALALVISAGAYVRWSANQNAMRARQALPKTPMIAAAVVGLSVAGALALALVVTW